MALQSRTGRTCAAIVGAALLLSGCQNMNDSQVTQLQGAGGGAAIGGAIGAKVGGAKGGAIGAALGAGVGLGVGSVIAERKRQYADAESFYEAQIRETQARNRQLAQYNDGLSREVSEYRMEIATLQTKVRAGDATYQAASRTNERIKASYADATKKLDEEQHELTVQQKVADELRQSKGEQAMRTQQENQQVAALSSHISVLQEQVDTMASQSNQLQQFK